MTECRISVPLFKSVFLFLKVSDLIIKLTFLDIKCTSKCCAIYYTISNKGKTFCGAFFLWTLRILICEHECLFCPFRSDSEHSKEVVRPYDWTYTTDYRGTLIGEGMQIQVGHSQSHNETKCHHRFLYISCWKVTVALWTAQHPPLFYLNPLIHPQVTKTSERIDIEKLKAREQIMFFDEVLLFEDELHDHGVSMISVKIVSSVYVLRE